MSNDEFVMNCDSLQEVTAGLTALQAIHGPLSGFKIMNTAKPTEIQLFFGLNVSIHVDGMVVLNSVPVLAEIVWAYRLIMLNSAKEPDIDGSLGKGIRLETRDWLYTEGHEGVALPLWCEYHK